AALGAHEGAGGRTGDIDGAVGRNGDIAGAVGAGGADIGDGIGARRCAIVGGAEDKGVDATAGGRHDASAAPGGQVGVAGGAGDIDLAAGNGQPADAAARRQVAQVLGPGRRGSDVTAGVFRENGMAILGAGDI